MGQPRVASVTWLGQNRHISQDSYEPVGQQLAQTIAAIKGLPCIHAQILNPVSSGQAKSPRKTSGIGQDFLLMGLWSFNIILEHATIAYDCTRPVPFRVCLAKGEPVVPE